MRFRRKAKKESVYFPIGLRQFTSPSFLLLHILWCFVGLGCSPVEQPVSGPLEIGIRWTSVVPPEPLRVVRREQKICLQVASLRDADFSRSVVVFADGKEHLLEGEALDNEGGLYRLGVGGIGGNSVCLYNTGKRPSGSHFPADRQLVELRLRSNPPLQIGKIWWYCSTNP